jgi:hypothetical protein
MTMPGTRGSIHLFVVTAFLDAAAASVGRFSLADILSLRDCINLHASAKMPRVPLNFQLCGNTRTVHFVEDDCRSTIGFATHPCAMKPHMNVQAAM